MKFLVLIIFSTLAVFLVRGQNSGPIQGRKATLGQFPWQVDIHAQNAAGAYKECSGVLVHVNWVLTTATCAKDQTWFNIFVGLYQKEQGGQAKIVTTPALIHEAYDPAVSRFNHNIALIKSPEAFKQDANAKVIELLPSSVSLLTKLEVSGWGRRAPPFDVNQMFNPDYVYEPDTLRFAGVSQTSSATCQQSFPAVTSQNTCTTGKAVDSSLSPCPSDDGSPLILRSSPSVPMNYLVGLYAFGGDICSATRPAGYLRVVPYTAWIKNRVPGL